MVCFPYPKRMCANIDVDQAAAVILCSYEAARAAGVPDDRMVFLHAAAEAHDHYFFTERCVARRLARRSPPRSATRSARPASTLDDVAHFDLYSCFPVGRADRRCARSASPTDDPRPLTVTGGLGFAGGPVNNYPTHGIARDGRSAPRRPGQRSGCTTALGWYVTKHAAAVWSASPPERRSGASIRPRAGPGRRATAAPSRPGWSTADVTIEATSVGVRARRHPVARHRDRADRRRPAGAGQRPRPRPARRDSSTEAHEGRPRSRSPTTARPTRSARAERRRTVP